MLKIAEVRVQLSRLVAGQVLKLGHLKLLHSTWLRGDVVQVYLLSWVELELHASRVHLLGLHRVYGHLVRELSNVADVGLCRVQPTVRFVVLRICLLWRHEIDRILSAVVRDYSRLLLGTHRLCHRGLVRGHCGEPSLDLRPVARVFAEPHLARSFEVALVLLLSCSILRTWEELLKGSEILLLELVSNNVKVLFVLLLEMLRHSEEFAVHDSVVEVHLHVTFVHCFALPGHSEEADRVSNQFSLDLLVEGAIGRETWTVVHLQEVRLGLLIEHDVEA